VSDEDLSAASAPRKWVFTLPPVYLLLIYFYRAPTPAHEFMLPGEWWLSALLDAGLTLALAASFGRTPAALYVPCLAAGAGLWIIRLHSNESWWRGHWMYWLEPR
jgi:hypothetical protein